MKLLTRLAAFVGVIAAGSGAWGQSSGLSPAGLTVEKTANEKPRFYGFAFDVTTADGSGLNAAGHNYRNDFVWYFEPTWNIGKMYLRNTRWQTLRLEGRWTLTANVSGTDEANFGGTANSGPQGTCGNPTINDNGGTVDPNSVSYCSPASNTRRADYSDILLTLRNPRVYVIPKIDVAINPSFRIGLPVSLQSQYATLIMSLQPAISAGRTFWKDRLRAGYGFGFTKYFHRSTVPQLNPSSGGAAATAGGNQFDGTNGAGISNFFNDPTRANGILTNPDFALVHTVSGGWQINDKWSLDVLYLIIESFPYQHGCTVDYNAMTYNTCDSGNAVASNSGATINRPGHHDTQVFWATLAYQPLDWLAVTLAWINAAPLLKPDSSYRQGLISTDYNQFTTIQLGATITVDKLAARYWRK